MSNPKKQSRDEFEINFYQGILNRSPNFVQVISALADLYTKNERYEDGLKLDEQLVGLRPDDPYVFYNLACSYSLLNEIDKALRAIKIAINVGYDDFNYLQKDPDLEVLRRDQRFQRFFSRVKKRYSEKITTAR